MALFQDAIFDNDAVELDGHTFTNCKFTNCKLIYRGGTIPTISGCSFRKVSFDFADAAADTLNFVQMLYHGGFKPIIKRTFDRIMKQKPTKGPTIH